MLIRVVRSQSQAPQTVCEASFGEQGGTIGRSTQCTLPLPDPERHISRIQAEINCTDNQFFLIDHGSANHFQHNGEMVTPGVPVLLSNGDELQIGDYVLQVAMAAAVASQDALLLDPLAGLMSPETEAQPLAKNHPFSHHSPKPGTLIPDDFDLFGKSLLAPGQVPDPNPVTASASGLPAEENLDMLFGLNNSAMEDPRHLGGVLDDPLRQPNTSSADDPFASLQSTPTLLNPAQRDDAPEIHTPIRLPEALPDEQHAFRSWENPEAIGSHAVQGTPYIGVTQRIVPESGNPVMNNDTMRFSQGEQDLEKPAAQAPTHLLLEALLTGAGLRELPQGIVTSPQPQRHLDAQTMERIGTLLRLFAQGVIDLLATRSTLKTEMHSAMTMIAAHGNNPLKFSPNSTAALAHLLAPRTLRGFMPPEDAVQDAMNDLVAHQVGVIAGMRAALQGLLQRFSPEALEARLATRSMLDAMLPKNRKAKLWEQFENTFNEVSKEAEDDFEALFSREFVRAYEEQIRALEERNEPTKQERS